MSSDSLQSETCLDSITSSASSVQSVNCRNSSGFSVGCWSGLALLRSGVWQYYEGLTVDKFARMTRALDQFRLSEIAEKYRFGHRSWSGPDQAASLDEWLDAHKQQIESAAFDLIAARKDDLKHET